MADTDGPVAADGDVREAASARRGSRFRLPAALASLRHRNYRLLWTGSLISNSGDWMDQVALNWLVYDLTGSAVALALLNFCRLVPISLFTLIGGVVADRIERRRLMFITQSVAMVLALALAVLVSMGVVELWMVLAIAVGRGLMMSFNQPARQSLISELVPREMLTNAIALNSATINLTRVLGPAIGGLLIVSVGVAGAFYVNGFSFLAVLYGLTQMRFPPRPPRQHEGIVSSLVGGVRYVAGYPELRTLVILALVPMIFGQPYMTMLTVFAADVLAVGGDGLGLLMACSGAGAVCGALYVASRGAVPGRRRVMVLGLVGFGVTLFGFAFSPWLWLSAVLLIGVGFAQQTFMALNNALIQEDVDPAYRGRIVSMLFVNRGLVPLGAMLAGIGTELIGAPLAMGMMALMLVALAIGAATLGPGLRDAAPAVDAASGVPATARTLTRASGGRRLAR